MKKYLNLLSTPYPAAWVYHVSLLFFRVLVSLQLMIVHGLKKIGIGVAEAEQVPNPLHLPEGFNHLFAIAGNLVFPVFIMIGFLTRLAVWPVLAITLTGYFVLHWHDPLLVSDTPFIYSVVFLLIAVLGAGKYSIDYWLYQKTRL